MSLFLVTEFAAYVIVCTFRFYTANVHYNLVLPNLKILIQMFEGFLLSANETTSNAPARNERVVSCSTLNCGFFS
jgi:hypothetical protein